MFEFTYIVVLIVLFVLQRRVCSKSDSLRKKLIIPVSYLLAASIFVLYINQVIYADGTEFKYQSNGSSSTDNVSQISVSDDDESYTVQEGNESVASISFMKMSLKADDKVGLFLLFNIPTFLFIIFIFTGKRYQKAMEA